MNFEELEKQKDEALTNYISKLQDYKDVCKGGKDYYDCSFMDISMRNDRMELTKKKLIEILGEIELEKIHKTLKLRNDPQ